MSVHRLLFGDLVARLGWRLPALITLMTLVGLGEGMSVALLLPLLSLLGLSSGPNTGLASRLIAKALSAVGATDPVEILAVIIVVSVVQTVLFIGLNWWSTRLARRYQAQRQAELFRAIIGAKWSFVVDRKAGELTNAIVTEAERMGTAFTIGLSIISTAVVMLTYFALSLLVAWQVTLTLAVFAALSALAMMRLYRKSYAAGQSLAPLSAELQSTLAEQFAAFKIIKATVSERRAAVRIDPLLRHLERALALVSFLPAMVRGLLEFLAVVDSRSSSCSPAREWESRWEMSLSYLLSLPDCFPASRRFRAISIILMATCMASRVSMSCNRRPKRRRSRRILQRNRCTSRCRQA